MNSIRSARAGRHPHNNLSPASTPDRMLFINGKSLNSLGTVRLARNAGIGSTSEWRVIRAEGYFHGLPTNPQVAGERPRRPTVAASIRAVSLTEIIGINRGPSEVTISR